MAGTVKTNEVKLVSPDGLTEKAISIDNSGNIIGTSNSYTATLPYTSWTGSSAPYSKAVTVSGILSTDTPIIDVVLSGVYNTDITIQDSWTVIYRAVTSENTITFYATSVPNVDIPIQIKVVR